MKREQLTNVTTESQCETDSFVATQFSKAIFHDRRCGYRMTSKRIARRVALVVECANRIIALRSQQVTP